MRPLPVARLRWAVACGFAFILLGAAAHQDMVKIGRYSFNPVQRAPDLPLTYDVRAVKFPAAPIAAVAADLGPTNAYDFVGKDGRKFNAPLDVKTLPFWSYAEYVDRPSGGRCRYVLINGLLPDGYQALPEAGDIEVGPVQQEPAVLRNCGAGFEIVSREGYSSLFDRAFTSAYLKGKGGPPVGADVPEGLAKDYVQRLSAAYGGKDALKEKLAKGRASWVLDRHLTALTAALAEQGLIKVDK